MDRKNMLFRNISKLLNIFSSLFLYLTVRFRSNFFECSKLEKAEKFQIQNFEHYFLRNNTARKNILFGNISKTTQPFFLILSSPPRKVKTTYFGILLIGIVEKFCNKIILSFFINIKKIIFLLLSRRVLFLLLDALRYP